MSRKEQIIELAADLLRTKGYDAFSFQDLAVALDIRKASVHHHFPKKEDLGIALCEWTRNWLQEGLDHFDRRADSNMDRLERYLRAAQKHCFDEHKMCPISALHGDLPVLPASMCSRIKALDDIELNWIGRVIRDGQESGEFDPDLDADAMAVSFVFSSKGALYYARHHGKEEHQALLQRVVAQLKKILVR